jgi:hypothetical protein
MFFATMFSPNSQKSLKTRKALSNLLVGFGVRGILTMLGFRKTTGSQNINWPGIKVLTDSFLKPHTVLSPEDLQK